MDLDETSSVEEVTEELIDSRRHLEDGLVGDSLDTGIVSE